MSKVIVEKVKKAKVTKALSEKVKKQTESKAEADNVQKQTVTKVEADNVQKQTLTKAEVDNVQKQTVTKVEVQNVQKQTVTTQVRTVRSSSVMELSVYMTNCSPLIGVVSFNLEARNMQAAPSSCNRLRFISFIHKNLSK